MFSGIVEEVGIVNEIDEGPEGRRFRIKAKLVGDHLGVGESISVSGVCLTVVSYDKASFTVEAVLETLRRTTLSDLKVQATVNLERALKLSDRLGGHLVTGHVDSVAKISDITADGFSKMISFEVDPQLAPFFVEKGSVAVDGISLTVIDFDQSREPNRFSFRVAVIPHTLDVTTLGQRKVGDTVNIETDVVARYVARWLAPSLGLNLNNDEIKMPFLVERR